MKDIHKSYTQRITSQQQAVFQIISKYKLHVTAENVFQEVRKTLPRISLATVYRNLDKLSEGKFIKKTVINGVFYYELDTSDHYHVICLACKRVDNIDSLPASDIEEFFSRSTEYKLTGHELILYGVCPNCQK